MATKTQYRVVNLHSWEVLSEWTDSEIEANKWRLECEEHETQPECRVVYRELILGDVTEEDLQDYALRNQGIRATGLITQGQFSCGGWYLEVDGNGYLTGSIVEADRRGYKFWGDELLGCVCKA